MWYIQRNSDFEETHQNQSLWSVISKSWRKNHVYQTYASNLSKAMDTVALYKITFFKGKD